MDRELADHLPAHGMKFSEHVGDVAADEKSKGSHIDCVRKPPLRVLNKVDKLIYQWRFDAR